jgi:Ulp1 family protease
VDLFSKHLVFVPVHDALHWSLLVLCNPGAPEPSDIAQLEPRHFNARPYPLSPTISFVCGGVWL